LRGRGKGILEKKPGGIEREPYPRKEREKGFPG